MIKRRLIELAIEAGRNHQSEQTKFVHYNYHSEECDHYDTIPVYENFLFVLALLKSRKGDYIQEAKLLLKRLLSYQTDASDQGAGNFPIYLHESPTCYSRWQGVKLLAPLYWMLKKFHHILGDELREKTKKSLEYLTIYCLRTLQENPADYLTTLRIASGAFSVGQFLENSKFEKEGSEMLNDLLQLGCQPIWFSRQGIAGILSSLQMVYNKISESPWKFFWNHAEKMWHPTLQSYCGPAFDERQLEKAPEPSLYDFYLLSFSQMPPSKISAIHVCHLKTILIHSGEDSADSMNSKDFDGSIGETNWSVKSSEQFAYSVIDQHSKMDPRLKKGFHPFYLQWKNDGKLYSLACAGGHINKMTYKSRGSEIDLYFTLSEPMISEHPLENRELIFYCTAHDDVKINVEGTRATTFKLGDTVQVETKLNLSLKFELEDGEGEFLGHLMPGNRPSQRPVSKQYPTEANDWQIFLRTIRKKSPCTIHVTLKMQS